MRVTAPPNQQSVQDENKKIRPNWQEYFSNVYKALLALQDSGTTAQRPTKGLYVGRPYFDITLGYTINYNGTNWVRWDGVVV